MTPFSKIIELPVYDLFSFFKLIIKFLMYLMDGGLTDFQAEVDCNTLKYPQVKLLTFSCPSKKGI